MAYRRVKSMLAATGGAQIFGKFKCFVHADTWRQLCLFKAVTGCMQFPVLASTTKNKPADTFELKLIAVIAGKNQTGTKFC